MMLMGNMSHNQLLLLVLMLMILNSLMRSGERR